MTQDSVTQADIRAGLRELGLSTGDTVLVHSSLSSFGHVEGGADTVIDALLATVDDRGCVVVPTLTLGASESPAIFDVRQSPSRSGRITEVLRQRPEAHRSHHPTGSAAAIGWAAEELTRHHVDTPCGLTSPYGLVYLRGGWCLFLGAPWSTNTMFHVAEEIAMPGYMRFAGFHDAVVIDESGTPQTIAFRRYNCYQSGVRRDLGLMGPIYEEAGVVRHTRIGQSDCRMIRARDVIDISVELLRTDPGRVFTYDS